MKSAIKQLVHIGGRNKDQDSETAKTNQLDTPESLGPQSTPQSIQEDNKPTANMSLAGKVALITGASKGIGKATALRLARDGARVVINYSSDKQAADEVVQQIGPNHAVAIKADVSRVSDIEFLVKQTVDMFGKIDILIPCAGMLPMSPLETTSEELFDKIFALNVKGPYFLAQKAAPHMQSGSHIILISTTLTAASTVMPPYLPYLATKGAIEQMVRVMSKDLGKKGICVNAVSPGPTGTELFLKNQNEQTLKMLSSMNPRGRIGEPEEIADTIAFLSGNDSRWVTGQNLRVNGGMA
ncbi:hypothetical protein G7Y79_00031g065730 [Physcia stellaris]|nr:hypothetical protein G7Y79_00031g065730 [Physcia stellaris]